MVKCSASKNPTNTSTMATISSNYWNAMALETTPGVFQQEKKKYGYDDCGVKCRINTGNNEDDWQPCQPWCMTCGYPPHICDEYTTRCTGTKIGRWFNEEKGEWIEAEPLTTEEQEQEEEDRWNQHKFGLCPICKVGLDDRADFTFNYKFDLRNGVMMCHDCSSKEYEKVDTCANCENRVGGNQIVASTWDQKTGKFSVQFCRFC